MFPVSDDKESSVKARPLSPPSQYLKSSMMSFNIGYTLAAIHPGKMARTRYKATLILHWGTRCWQVRLLVWPVYVVVHSRCGPGIIKNENTLRYTTA